MLDRYRRRLPRPAGLLFDFGGTLCGPDDLDPRAGTEKLLEHALEPFSIEESLARAAWLDREIAPNRTTIEISGLAVQRILYETLGPEGGPVPFDITPEQRERVFFEGATSYRPEPHLREMLDTADELGLPVAVISNSMFSGIVLESALRRHGLLERFRFVMSSADYAFRKPHPLMFRVAAERLSLPTASLWYTGDWLRYDVRGAHAAGMTGIWYNRLQREPDDEIEPDATIQDWAEFATLLKSTVA